MPQSSLDSKKHFKSLNNSKILSKSWVMPKILQKYSKYSKYFCNILMVGSCPSPHWIVRSILSLYIIAKYCLRAELGQIVEKKNTFCLGLLSFPMVSVSNYWLVENIGHPTPTSHCLDTPFTQISNLPSSSR